MNDAMVWVGGRAPPGQNTPMPCAGTRPPGDARGSRVPTPRAAHPRRSSAKGEPPRRLQRAESIYAGSRPHTRPSTTPSRWPPIANRVHPGAPASTNRTARSSSSGESLFECFIAPVSQELEPPGNPGRFTVLESLFLLERFPPWHSNRLSRLVKRPKLHVADTGLAAALLGADTEAIKADRTLLGQLLETLAFQELRRQASWYDARTAFFHFRGKDGVEVDIVIELGSRAVAGVEVKAAATVTQADFRGLRKLAGAAGDRFACGVVLYDGEASVRFGDRLHAVPPASATSSAIFERVTPWSSSRIVPVAVASPNTTPCGRVAQRCRERLAPFRCSVLVGRHGEGRRCHTGGGLQVNGSARRGQCHREHRGEGVDCPLSASDSRSGFYFTAVERGHSIRYRRCVAQGVGRLRAVGIGSGRCGLPPDGPGLVSGRVAVPGAVKRPAWLPATLSPSTQ